MLDIEKSIITFGVYLNIAVFILYIFLYYNVLFGILFYVLFCIYIFNPIKQARENY